MTIVLESERLIFREWNDADLPAFHRICSDRRVMKYVGDGQPWPLKTTEQFIRHATQTFRETGFCQWPLIYKADSVLIGYCGFAQTEDGPEIGWRLAAGHWGKGLATEAARVALEHGLQKLSFQHVYATVQSANLASIHVIEKLGMHKKSSSQRNGQKVLTYYSGNDRDEKSETT